MRIGLGLLSAVGGECARVFDVAATWDVLYQVLFPFLTYSCSSFVQDIWRDENIFSESHEMLHFYP